MARKTEIVNKSVTFDRTDPDQNADLEFALKRSNFSAFVRTLIHMERLRQTGALTSVALHHVPQQEEEIDAHSAEGFI